MLSQVLVKLAFGMPKAIRSIDLWLVAHLGLLLPGLFDR